jgi:hypothetical protein
MQFDPDCADFRQRQISLFAIRITLHFPASPIGVGETVVAVAPLESGIARCFALFNPPKERLKCSIQTPQHVLQDMRGNVLVLGPDLGFDLWQVILLIIVADCVR